MQAACPRASTASNEAGATYVRPDLAEVHQAADDIAVVDLPARHDVVPGQRAGTETTKQDSR